jgi:hypothetical protein
MVDVCQEGKKFGQEEQEGRPKKRHDDALSERVCVCSPSPGHQSNALQNRVYSSRRLPDLALDKQATKQTRRAST